MSDDLYREQILEHYKNPHHFGELPDADITQEGDNPLCGDVVTFYLKLDDGHLADVRFRGRGCAISQASASMLTDMIVGKPVDELRHFPTKDLLEELGIQISPARMKCATLSVNTLRVALNGDSPEED
ncbi:MAG TPA: SUF system NifU family Fe-S cluster assembly protein [Candidatus Angelobacter sp.]|nr:SUF system NifU family Fe-S cluster assembly protein [Candidatus Angelobacter sp.]